MSWQITRIPSQRQSLLRLSFDIIITQAAASRQGQLTHEKAGSKYLYYPDRGLVKEANVYVREKITWYS